MRHEAEARAILKQVELWPFEEKQWLGRRLIAAADGPVPPGPPGPVPFEQRGSLGDLLGIANPTGRPYSDDEIDQIRYGALAEKQLR